MALRVVYDRKEWDGVFANEYKACDLLVFADWLEENGDPLVDEVRVLADYLSSVGDLSGKSGIMACAPDLPPSVFVGLTAMNLAINIRRVPLPNAEMEFRRMFKYP